MKSTTSRSRLVIILVLSKTSRILFVMPQEEGSSIDYMVISVSKPTMMLGMQVTREIINLLPAIAHILEVTLSLGDCRSKRRYCTLAWSLSIEVWLRLRGRWYDFDHFSKISTSLLPLQCTCIVIIQLLSLLLAIPFFMSVGNTLRLIVTTFGKRLCPKLSPHLMWHHLINLQTSSQRV